MEAAKLRGALRAKQGELTQCQRAAAVAEQAAEASEKHRREERASWQWRLQEQSRVTETWRADVRRLEQEHRRETASQDPDESKRHEDVRWSEVFEKTRANYASAQERQRHQKQRAPKRGRHHGGAPPHYHSPRRGSPSCASSMAGWWRESLDEWAPDLSRFACPFEGLTSALEWPHVWPFQ